MAESEPGQDPGLPEDARLTSLDRRLKQAQPDEAQRTEGRQPNVAKWARSPEWRILSVLIGYPVGSALIGVAIDYFAGTEGAWVVDAVRRVRRRDLGNLEDFEAGLEIGRE